MAVKKYVLILTALNLLVFFGLYSYYQKSYNGYEVFVSYLNPSDAGITKSQTDVIVTEVKHPEDNIEQQNLESEDVRIVFPIDINTATKNELMQIPKIGDVISDRIISHRDRLGGYKTLEQLMEVKGIGQKTFDDIKSYLYI